eukprot:TRINITY_DN2171_c0_g1_i4.p1 TRINITY_DN2171_c0_g1~~TRINITY_DN2171_c0_g1_i4.p1  ORF type:complete len:347 (+),score=67.04 TRINITY_DN2171_c0_g1_i4:187-1227(+)
MKVIVEKRGASVTVTMNRPKVLNSLSLDMVRYLTPLYTQWEEDPSVSSIILRGQGRAFCAGGDIVQIYESGKTGTSLSRDFFREEYVLNHLIGTLRTPHVAIIDGITMGGGVGLSVHGKFRVASDNTVFAMPETGIGFFPDVGGTYFLPRLKGALGMFLGLTGYRLKGKHVVCAGIGTHYVPTENLKELENSLSMLTSKDSQHVEELISKFSTPVDWGDSEILPNMELINSAFSEDSVEGIIARLEENGSEFSEKLISSLRKMSPTSLKVTHKQLTLGKNLSFSAAFQLEYNISQQFMKGTDFYEGVGELLVTKTNKPRWNPPTLEEVTDDEIQKYFQILHPSSRV